VTSDILPDIRISAPDCLFPPVCIPIPIHMSMTIPYAPELIDADPDALLLIVTGSGIEPEATDRAAAYELANTIRTRLPAGAPRGPLVVSDLWYLNQPAIHRAAAITIGRPEINAASAMLVRRIPTALVIDGRLRIQCDVEGIERRACIYGIDHQMTKEAVLLFRERHLETWMESAAPGAR